MAQYLLNVLNYPENPSITYYEFSIECSTHFSVPLLQNLLQVWYFSLLSFQNASKVFWAEIKRLSYALHTFPGAYVYLFLLLFYFCGKQRARDQPTGWTTPGSKAAGKGNSSLYQNVQTGSGAPFIQLIPWGPFSEVKRPDSHAYHSSAPTADIKNEWSYTPHPYMPSCIGMHFIDYVCVKFVGYLFKVQRRR